MPNYRRAWVPGGSFFFTVVTFRRANLFANAHARRLLGSTFRRCALKWPFTVDAIVLLPQHLHAIWTLPPGDTAYPMRWGWIKKEFTREWLSVGGSELPVSAASTNERRRGVWQPRFWEHTLESEDDYERHFDYIHFNPVKHGYATSPSEWRWSSFHRWARAGVYPLSWGDPSLGAQPVFGNLEDNVGEPA
jgi:putative transposase